MLLEYLKCEVDSSRFGERLKKTLEELNLSTDIILNANLENQEENNQRKLIMEKFRWYPTDDIFKNFPKEIKWYFVEFEEGDFDKIYYLDWFSWNDISNNTSKPIEAAKNIRNGIKYYDIPTERFFEGLEYIEKGGKFNPIIAITCNEEKMVLVEGHYRVTVYAMKPELFNGTYGYIGLCSKEEMELYNSKIV